nr:hypothetical protein [Aeromonas dhakensis]
MVATASRNAALLALVVIVILLANQGQLVANVGMNLVTIDLLAQQLRGIQRPPVRTPDYVYASSLYPSIHNTFVID